jgi:ribosomal protein L7Ae-like RNA K-turn-binding protein
MLGLGLRGRLIVVGVDRVREAAKGGTLRLAIVAQDASENSLGKVVPLLEAKQVRMIAIDSAATLGSAVDREATTVIGIVDAQFAKGIRGLADAAGA